MKKIRVHLSNPRWTQSIQPQSNIHLRGTVFDGGAIHRTAEELTSCFSSQLQHDVETWGERVSMLNGFFSLIVESATQAMAAVDRIRSIPLFYATGRAEIFISDDAEWVRQQIGDEAIDPLAREEFQLTGYVTGRETLFPNVKQLQAGELLVIDKTKGDSVPVLHRYYRFLHAEPKTFVEDALRTGLEHSAIGSMNRLIDYANGRQIVIPLSGGYDSRLIATLLCKLGYKKILTFSYGLPGNKESAYSRQVAEALGLKWHFVEYSAERWRTAWNTEQRLHYQKWASNWTSLPHIQDWIAVRDLKNIDAVNEDCVFVPGHSGDFVAGSHIPDVAFQDCDVSVDTLVKEILQRHYSLSGCRANPRERFTAWNERVMERAEVKALSLQTEFADAFEKWDWQERQAKFICNSIRVYEFFGYDWWLPLWDAAFMEFWQGVPLILRKERRWYVEYVKQTYASQTGVHGQYPLGNSSEIGIVEKSIRSIMNMFPASMKSYLRTLQYIATPRQTENVYAVSHLPRAEVKKRLSDGYCVNSILAEDFFRSLS